MDINIEFVNLMFPFLIHFVFECKLDVTAAYLHRVNE